MSAIIKDMNSPKTCEECSNKRRCKLYDDYVEAWSSVKPTPGQEGCTLKPIEGLIASLEGTETMLRKARGKGEAAAIGIHYAIDTIKEYCEMSA